MRFICQAGYVARMLAEGFRTIQTLTVMTKSLVYSSTYVYTARGSLSTGYATASSSISAVVMAAHQGGVRG